MDKSQQITKQEYEMEFGNDKFNSVDLPQTSDLSDDDLPDGIEVD